MDARSYDSNADAHAARRFDLYPHFYRDADGNIYARYANGERITIVHANRIARFDFDRDTDRDEHSDAFAGAAHAADNGRTAG